MSKYHENGPSERDQDERERRALGHAEALSPNPTVSTHRLVPRTSRVPSRVSVWVAGAVGFGLVGWAVVASR